MLLRPRCLLITACGAHLVRFRWVECVPTNTFKTIPASVYMRGRIRHGMSACDAEFGPACGNPTPNSARYVGHPLPSKYSARGDTSGNAKVRHGMLTCEAEFDIARRILTYSAESARFDPPPKLGTEDSLGCLHRNWQPRISSGFIFARIFAFGLRGAPT